MCIIIGVRRERNCSGSSAGLNVGISRGSQALYGVFILRWLLVLSAARSLQPVTHAFLRPLFSRRCFTRLPAILSLIHPAGLWSSISLLFELEDQVSKVSNSNVSLRIPQSGNRDSGLSITIKQLESKNQDSSIISSQSSFATRVL